MFAGALHAQHQPYAGQHERELKAPSAEEVKQYLAGAGMGYAKAAELNRFPGPMHALELADQLKLTGEQRATAKQLMDAHKAEARGLGADLVAAERELERCSAAARSTRRSSPGRCALRPRSRASTGCRTSRRTAACASSLPRSK